VRGRPRHPQSQGCIERGNAPFKDALSRWMDENQTSDWTLGAYIVNSRINQRAIESRANQTPCDLMFGECPKLDDALGDISSYIQSEQGILGVTELLQHFRTKIPNKLLGDDVLHILAIVCDELQEQEEQLKTQEEIEAFDIDRKRKSRVNYIAKVNLDYDSDDDEVTAGDHFRHVIRVHNEFLTNIYGEDIIPQFPREVEVPQGEYMNDSELTDNNYDAEQPQETAAE
jgi:hypothetical protein